MRKSQLILIVFVIAAVTGVILYWSFKQTEQIQTEQIQIKTETNPIKKIPNLNPIEKANPFKAPNPFE